MLLDQLKVVQSHHHAYLRDCAQKLEVAQAASRVLSAVKSGVSGQIKGDDMFRFMECIQSNAVFVNTQAISKAAASMN